MSVSASPVQGGLQTRYRGAADTSGRSDYSRTLGRRLLDLAERLQRSPGDPDVRRSLNDVLHEARHNPRAIVSGEALSRATRALALSRPHGPPRAGGAALLRQIDPRSARDPYSQAVEARLRDATRAYGVEGGAESRRRLNDVLHEARRGTAVVSLEALTLADRALGRGARAARPAVTQLADLSSAPGAQGVGNYVGVEGRDLAGRRTLTQVRLRTQLELGSDGQWQIRRIEAVGPQVAVDGRLASESGKAYLLRDAQGRLILDPLRARERARELLRHGAITPAGGHGPGSAAAMPPRPGAPQAAGPAPVGALQPFFGVHLAKPGAEHLLARLPGVSALLQRAKAAMGGHAPGAVVFAPGPKTLFATSKDKTVAAIPGLPLRPVVVVGSSGIPQIGLGDAGALAGSASDFWFWNVRAAPEGIASAISRSRDLPGVPAVVGTVNSGIMTSPECRRDPAGGSASTTLAGGLNFQAQMVAKDGQVYIRSGPIMLPPAVFQAVMSAAGSALSARSALVCRGGDAAQAVAQLGLDIRRRLQGLLSSGEIQRHAAGIAALAAALAAAAVGEMMPRAAF